MTTTNWFLTSVLVSTLLSSASFAQQPDEEASRKPNEISAIEFQQIEIPEISVAPNPIRDIAKFKFDQAGDKNWVVDFMEVYDVLGNFKVRIDGSEFKCGKNIQQPCVLEYEADLTDLENGIYLIRVNTTHNLTKKSYIRTTRAVLRQE